MNEENLKRLKSWMSENKHSQQEIADRMGVSQAYVNQLLNGLSKFGKRTALTWRDEFGFNPKWLLYEEEPMFTYEEEDPEHISKNLYNNKNDGNLIKQLKVAPLVPIDITRQACRRQNKVFDSCTAHIRKEFCTSMIFGIASKKAKGESIDSPFFNSYFRTSGRITSRSL